jgi:hypothetical protein
MTTISQLDTIYRILGFETFQDQIYTLNHARHDYMKALNSGYSDLDLFRNKGRLALDNRYEDTLDRILRISKNDNSGKHFPIEFHCNITQEEIDTAELDRKEKCIMRFNKQKGASYFSKVYWYWYTQLIISSNNIYGGRKIRKHRGIHQAGGKKGKLKKGYKYSGKRLKSGLAQIIKTIKKTV